MPLRVVGRYFSTHGRRSADGEGAAEVREVMGMVQLLGQHFKHVCINELSRVHNVVRCTSFVGWLADGDDDD